MTYSPANMCQHDTGCVYDVELSYGMVLDASQVDKAVGSRQNSHVASNDASIGASIDQTRLDGKL
jgi:hypothetical protein